MRLPPHGYEGRVIDAETKLPLADAAVVVIWMKQPAISIDAVESFQAARETLTDADGRFALDATPPKTWNPFRPLREQLDVVVFAPGYGSFPLAYGVGRPEWFKPAPRTSTSSSSPESRSLSSCLD